MPFLPWVRRRRSRPSPKLDESEIMNAATAEHQQSIGAAFDGPASSVVRDDVELLEMMITDSIRQSGIWQPKARWRRYAERISHELNRSGLKDFRTNQVILKGYAPGGVLMPAKPASAWKRAIWEAAEYAPVVRAIVAEYRRLLGAQHKALTDNEKYLARHVLRRVAETFPDFRPPQGSTNGGAEDGFLWRGCEISAAWARYLSRAADLYQVIDRDSVTRILEIGPGLCLSTLAHISLNPTLRVVVNVDIPPVLYVSTQFLRSVPGLDIVDYRDTRDHENITIEPGPAGRTRVYQLAPWQIARIDGSVDVFLNAGSFQEMTREVCENYARYCNALTEKAVMLHADSPGLAGPEIGISSEFLIGLYEGKFPSQQVLDFGWCEDYEVHGLAAIVLRPKRA